MFKVLKNKNQRGPNKKPFSYVSKNCHLKLFLMVHNVHRRMDEGHLKDNKKWYHCLRVIPDRSKVNLYEVSMTSLQGQ